MRHNLNEHKYAVIITFRRGFQCLIIITRLPGFRSFTLHSPKYGMFTWFYSIVSIMTGKSSTMCINCCNNVSNNLKLFFATVDSLKATFFTNRKRYLNLNESYSLSWYWPRPIVQERQYRFEIDYLYFVESFDHWLKWSYIISNKQLSNRPTTILLSDTNTLG